MDRQEGNSLPYHCQKGFNEHGPAQWKLSQGLPAERALVVQGAAMPSHTFSVQEQGVIYHMPSMLL